MSILSSFKITALHGYKEIEIDCKGNASIILAENGVGKTTLLNTMYALLSGRISRLMSLDFDKAVLVFGKEEIVFSKNEAFNIDIKQSAVQIMNKRQARELVEYGVKPEHVIDLLLEYVQGGKSVAARHPVFRRIYTRSPWDEDEIFGRLERLRNNLYNESYLRDFRSKIANCLQGAEVLYLPTYRRIEANSEDINLVRPTPRRKFLTEIEGAESERDELIFFGLSDVEDKLAFMCNFIQKSMIEAYSRLSGNLIDTLLGKAEYEVDVDLPMDVEAVRLMLGRLGKNNTMTESSLDVALGRSDIQNEKFRPLVYFLQQLLRSYEDSRPHELAIEEFQRVVNFYLNGGEVLEKHIRFDKIKLKVEVWHEALKCALPFGCLSSGEKQIVSVFARLLLDFDKRYLILIDEPELSLSIEWQRRFLPDILQTKSCAQLIAITHSPFVFENDLDQFARSINVSRGNMHDPC